MYASVSAETTHRDASSIATDHAQSNPMDYPLSRPALPSDAQFEIVDLFVNAKMGVQVSKGYRSTEASEWNPEAKTPATEGFIRV